MIKVGIIFTAWKTLDYISDSLAPWTNRNNVIVAAVSIPFQETAGMENEDDGTLAALQNAKQLGRIAEVFTEPKYIKEHEARDLALQYLLKQNVDFVMILDSDEMYKPEEINRILDYIQQEENEFFTWFKINFKNYVFDVNLTQWVGGFCPPRIFRVQSGGYKLNRVYYDNDMTYIKNGQEFDYKQFASKSIPTKTSHIKHVTWISDERCRKKTEYQKKRWGTDGCSFDWDYINNKLIFNQAFYLKTGGDYPEIYRD